MGVALESDGLPRIAGRIFGLLLVSEDARSLDDLAAELRVSKGSVSTNARLLEQRGLVGAGLPARATAGTTTACARISSFTRWPSDWRAGSDSTKRSARRGPACRIRSQEVRDRLEEYEQAYAFMSQVIGEALARWRGNREDRLAGVGAPG